MQDWTSIDCVRRACEDPAAPADHLLRALASVADARETLRDAERGLIQAARTEGLTWRRIASALELNSPQAALQRGLRVGALGPRPPARPTPDDRPDDPERP